LLLRHRHRRRHDLLGVRQRGLEPLRELERRGKHDRARVVRGRRRQQVGDLDHHELVRLASVVHEHLGERIELVELVGKLELVGRLQLGGGLEQLVERRDMPHRRRSVRDAHRLLQHGLQLRHVRDARLPAERDELRLSLRHDVLLGQLREQRLCGHPGRVQGAGDGVHLRQPMLHQQLSERLVRPAVLAGRHAGVLRPRTMLLDAVHERDVRMPRQGVLRVLRARAMLRRQHVCERRLSVTLG
jgi:hypothetical protein